MNQNRGQALLVTFFLVGFAVITWSELKLRQANNSPSPIGWPRPQRYVGLGITFSMLSIFGSLASMELAAVIGVGMVVGLLMQTAQASANTAANQAANNTNETVVPPSQFIPGSFRV